MVADAGGAEDRPDVLPVLQGGGGDRVRRRGEVRVRGRAAYARLRAAGRGGRTRRPRRRRTRRSPRTRTTTSSTTRRGGRRGRSRPGPGARRAPPARGDYRYAYTASANAAGVNAWAVKTVETLPDGNTNTVYTNASGQVMLKAYRDAATGQQWATYYMYDTAGRVVLEAATVGGDGVRRRVRGPGAVRVGERAVPGGRGGAGDHARVLVPRPRRRRRPRAGRRGFEQAASVKRGETGVAGAAGRVDVLPAGGGAGATATPVATQTVYRNDDGTGAETMSFAYAWFAGAAQPAVRDDDAAGRDGGGRERAGDGDRLGDRFMTRSDGRSWTRDAGGVPDVRPVRRGDRGGRQVDRRREHGEHRGFRGSARRVGDASGRRAAPGDGDRGR